jgi:pilus assembly protein CpaC
MRKNPLATFLLLAFVPCLHAGQQPIHLKIGDSKLVQVESNRKVAIDNPSIAGLTAVGDDEILISARAAGSAKLILISPNGQQEILPITVITQKLKKRMIEVGVEIMEIDSQSALKAGLSWGSIASPASGASVTTSNSLSIGENASPPLVAIGSLSREALAANLELLVTRGKAKVLSKPKLLTVSGEEASFLAGGEIPYATESKVGSTNVQWKPYGVKLRIKPIADGNDNINASLRAEVSEVDNSNGIMTGGILIPALKTRWAETSVYMGNGSTFVIAGLIDEQNQKTTNGIPILSDIPILGEIFRFTEEQKRQTELVIFVTPTLVGQVGHED